MACDPLIADPFVFPARPRNRAGLPRIGYRIGRYADFAEAMKRGIDAAPELAAWTHRDADDPGIALLEGAAIIGDILSFYQEHYANEVYLRTATWRDSVAELVRLTGYRLAPGLGGRATLAFEVRGTASLTLPARFRVKADLADVTLPAEFETVAALTAWPHLGRFNLYRPRHYAPMLAAGATRFEVAGGTVKPGDRLLLLAPEPGWTTSSAAMTAQQAPQVVKVTAVTTRLGRAIVDIDTPLAAAWAQPVDAFVVGRTFSHFGYNAPPNTVANRTGAGGALTGAVQSATTYKRHIASGTTCGHTSAAGALPAALIPLDSEVTDLRVGMRIVVEVSVSRVSAGPTPLAVARRVAAVAGGAMTFGNLTGATTRLTLDKALVGSAMTGAPTADVRDYRVHEVLGPPLQLRPEAQPTTSVFADGSTALEFWGTAEEARTLAGRRLYLAHPDGRAVEVRCTNVESDFADAAAPALWPLDFDRPPLPLAPADFDAAAPTVTVYGNLADASQGKTEADAVLGNGDHRVAWQTFALPKAPLTYFVDAAGVPAHAPELDVFVGGQMWTRVDVLFGRGAADRIYILREDAEGRSFVQFGDGRTGARLPSGIGNVVAVYRTGSGAHGPAKPGATPTASERPPGFDKVSLAGIVSGGAAPETADKAREAAPGKLQGLGRLVSLADYETETLGVPGVVAAVAAWDLHGGVPTVILRVFLEAGREAEFADVRKAIAHAQRCRGSDRFALVVEQGLPRFAFADLGYARDPRFRSDDVAAAIRTALGLFGDAASERGGVFGRRARRLGEPEYATRIEARVQAVPGILWCRLTALGLFPPAVNPPDCALLPPPRPRVEVLAASPHELLQLAAAHLTLTEVAEPSTGECA